MKYRMRKQMLIVLSILILIALFIILKDVVHIYGKEYTIASTCDTAGGIYKDCIFCEKRSLVSVIPISGHNGIWTDRKKPTSATPGEKELRCTVCKQLLDLLKIPPKDADVPTIRIIGSGIGMPHIKSVNVNFNYKSSTSHDNRAESMGTMNVRLMNEIVNYDWKHNYILNNFSMFEGYTLSFSEFGYAEQIELHSNVDDRTRTRRIVSSKLWQNVTSEKYPNYDKYNHLKDNMSYAGYNTLLYINSKGTGYGFAGIYTLTVPYSDFITRVDGNEKLYILKQTMKDGQTNFEHVFGNKEKLDSMTSSLKDMLTSNSKFKTMSDPELLIDYYCFADILGNTMALDNLYWIYNGKKWLPQFIATEYVLGCQKDSMDLVPSNTSFSGENAFWNNLVQSYSETIYKRTFELVDDVLSPANVRQEFITNISLIEDDIYEDEHLTYEIDYIPPSYALDEIVEWYNKRIEALNIK